MPSWSFRGVVDGLWEGTILPGDCPAGQRNSDPGTHISERRLWYSEDDLAGRFGHLARPHLPPQPLLLILVNDQLLWLVFQLPSPDVLLERGREK